MSFDFVHTYGGCRLDNYIPPPPMDGEPGDDTPPEGVKVNLDYEQDRAEWQAIDAYPPQGWHASDWQERPVRFVDGKDVGETIAWLRSPGGYPAPLRLSQLGGVVLRVEDGECYREHVVTERVVSMVVDMFPAHEIERFAMALQEHDLRLLPAQPPDGRPSYDFEQMRKAAQNRSNDEMGVLEEAMIAQDADTPTIVDGRLEPRSGGFISGQHPIFGVIKTQRKTYLHARGMQLLYDLDLGQRTPAFCIQEGRLWVVSWYLRLDGGGRAMPNWGIVRVEVAQAWFEARPWYRGQCDFDTVFIDQLSRTLIAYRCRERSYGRSSVSLHPIVRAEESLGACFRPIGMLTQHFYRLTGL